MVPLPGRNLRWKEPFMGALDTISNRWKGVLQRSFFNDEKHLTRVGISYKDVKITAAEMDALNGTPKELVAAPGSGKVLECLGVLARLDAGATPFELGSGTVDVRYENGSGGLAAQLTNAFVEGAADALFKAPSLACVALENKALVAYASADVTAGDGVLYLRVFYRTVVVSEVDPAVN